MPLSLTLTSKLLFHPETREQYTRATQSAFLSLAGQGRLPRDSLSRWLSQDRLYAQAYTRFIGGLLARTRLPVDKPSACTVEWRVLKVLKDALEGIVRELGFFEETAKKYGLNLAQVEGREEGVKFGPSAVTKGYVDLFDSFGIREDGTFDTEKSLFDGLVLLWATERVYLDAWTYAKEQGGGKDAQKEGGDLDGGALRKEFIPNWTSDEFRSFVDQIQDCLEDYAVKDGYDHEAFYDSLQIWARVLELEEGFWPAVNLQDVTSTVEIM